ncbi:MAG: inositol monophosphatase [Roseovarius sp.]|nr:inositol monophosphatase [Roseovarius sp.]
MSDNLPIPLSAPLSRAQQSTLVNLVRRAAKAEILPRFRNMNMQDISTKSGRYDLVTEADTATEAMLARGLQRMFPHALIVGEEAASADDKLRGKIAEAELCFVLDPVDGTWNFANGLPLFGVIVAVTRFGKPVLGLLYDPVMDDWIIADEATPARMVRAVGAERGLSVSKGGALSDMSGYIHLYLLERDKQDEMATALPDFGRTQVLRCSCHEYRTLAQGNMDFCLSGTMNPWDHAAGVLICQMAGGHVAMLDGSDYNAGLTEGYLLAAPDVNSWKRLRDRFSFLMS